MTVMGFQRAQSGANDADMPNLPFFDQQHLAQHPILPSGPMSTTDLGRNTASQDLGMKITKLLTPSGEAWDYIYIRRSQWDIRTMSVLTISFSEYHPEHGAHESAAS